MISICFSTDPKSWVSRIIRWFTKSKFSHVFLFVTNDPILGDYVLQADTDGVEVTSPARFNFNKNPILKQIIPQSDLRPAIKSCLSLLNDQYDFGGLLGMAFVELQWHLFKRKIANPLHFNKNAFFCSAFVVKVLQEAKWPGADSLVPENTDVQMLADFLSNP